MWFEDMMGFAESDGDDVRDKLSLDGTHLTSVVNGRTVRCGTLETPSLDELRRTSTSLDGADSLSPARTILREVVGDVNELHRDSQNAGALFQVASQFNLLEMASPSAVPEDGVGIYQYDRTQGPACAVACGAGTIQRNWFAPVVVGADEPPQIGQTRDHQIDCLVDLAELLRNDDQRLWTMQNGYCFATSDGLDEIATTLADLATRKHLLGSLRIGLQQDTEVTLSGTGHLVSQVYCSAMPVGYSAESTQDWEPFARLALDAAYESTFLAAEQNAIRTGNNRLFLTLLGGGVFGNPLSWITAAIERALLLRPESGLDVVIVSFGSSQAAVRTLISRWEQSG